MGFFEEVLFLVFITMLPGIELRGSIVYGVGVGLDPVLVFFLAVASNIAIIFPIYVFLKFVFPFFENLPVFMPLIEHVRKKTAKFVDRHGFLGLALFVAVPLPGSGVYSGALGAHLFGLKKRKAIPAMILGVILAGIIVTLLSIGFFGFVF